jgi:hypothetical protein
MLICVFKTHTYIFYINVCISPSPTSTCANHNSLNFISLHSAIDFRTHVFTCMPPIIAIHYLGEKGVHEVYVATSRSKHGKVDHL